MKESLQPSGDSVSLTIPREVAERYHLVQGVEMEIFPGDDGILLRPLDVAPWFSFEWERALDAVIEQYKTALDMIREVADMEKPAAESPADAGSDS
jgi:antitoxin component of MazEF toxin-antitoxin module